MHGALDAGGKVGRRAGGQPGTGGAEPRETGHADRRATGAGLALRPVRGFNVGHAMQRNKLIYALADAALVVNSDLDKGGTWAGAVEQLEKRRMVPVYVRSTGDSLRRPGCSAQQGSVSPWPNPEDAATFEAAFEANSAGRDGCRASRIFWCSLSTGSPARRRLEPENDGHHADTGDLARTNTILRLRLLRNRRPHDHQSRRRCCLEASAVSDGGPVLDCRRSRNDRGRECCSQRPGKCFTRS